MSIKTSDRSLRALRTLFVGVYLIVSIVFFPFVGDSVREPKWIFLWLTAPVLLLAVLVLHGREFGSFLRRLPWYLLLPLLYFLIQGFFLTSMTYYLFFWISVVSLFSLASAAVFLYQMSPELFQSRGVRLSFYAIFFFHGGLAILQAFGLDPLFELHDPTMARSLAGFMGHHTFFGLLMALVAVIGLCTRRWVVFVAGLLLCAASLSTTAAAALGATLTVYLVWRRRFLFAASLLSAGIIFSVFRMLHAKSDHDYFNDNGRLNIWIMLVKAALYKPWFGYGINSFAYEFPYQQGFHAAPWRQAHNEYLELLFCGGVVGLALTMAILIPLWRRRKEWWGSAVAAPFFFTLVVVLVNSLANFPLHIAPFALYALTSYIYLVTYERNGSTNLSSN